MEDIDVIDKVSLISKKDNLYDLEKSLLDEGFRINTVIEENFSSLSFITENPDPIEIAINFKDNSLYRVSYWDGYGVTEFYDYPQLNKAYKKFIKFVSKAKSNIDKFGLK